MQIPGELGLSGPSQKCGTCAEGSVAGAGSQFPPPPLAGGTRHTGVGRGFTIMAFTEYVRPLLHALIPGPLAPRQSALVAQGRPVVPSNPWPEGWVVPTPVASWSSAPSDEPPLASVDDGHPMHAPKLWPSSSQVWAPVDATPGQAQATCWPGVHARWSAPSDGAPASLPPDPIPTAFPPQADPMRRLEKSAISETILRRAFITQTSPFEPNRSTDRDGRVSWLLSSSAVFKLPRGSR